MGVPACASCPRWRGAAKRCFLVLEFVAGLAPAELPEGGGLSVAFLPSQEAHGTPYTLFSRSRSGQLFAEGPQGTRL